LEAEFFGPFGQRLDAPLAVTFLAVGLILIDVFFASGELGMD